MTQRTFVTPQISEDNKKFQEKTIPSATVNKVPTDIDETTGVADKNDEDGETTGVTDKNDKDVSENGEQSPNNDAIRPVMGNRVKTQSLAMTWK